MLFRCSTARLCVIFLFAAVPAGGFRPNGAALASAPAGGAEAQTDQLDPGQAHEQFLRALGEGDESTLRALCAAPTPEAAQLLDAETRLSVSYASLSRAFATAFGQDSLKEMGFWPLIAGFVAPEGATWEVNGDHARLSGPKWDRSLIRNQNQWQIVFDMKPHTLLPQTARSYKSLPDARIITNTRTLGEIFGRVAGDVRAAKYLSAADAYGVLNAEMHGFGRLGPMGVAACIDLGSPAEPATAPAALTIPILELRGDPETLGRTHGQQLGKVIHQLYDGYIGRFYIIPGARQIALRSSAGFAKFISPEHHQEILALAASTGFEPGEMLFAQCFLDMAVNAGCSTITLPAAASADGVARFARNLDFPSFDIADRHTVVIVYHPTDRYAFASICWPGMLGVLSGMNEHGLTLSNMEIRRRPRTPSAMPYTLLYRTVLEKCRTVDEAIALLERTPRQSANNLMLMDAAGHRATVEITPEKITVRRAPETAALISTNHHRGTDLDQPGRCRRYDSMHDAAKRQFGTLSESALERMLAATCQGNLTMQSMVFEPANRVVYLAVGINAPMRGYTRIDLKPCFR